jgi:ferrochelatase
MEVLYDLDTQAKALCQKMNIGYYRAKTAQHRLEFILMVKQLVDEKMAEPSKSSDCDQKQEFCFEGCCPVG